MSVYIVNIYVHVDMCVFLRLSPWGCMWLEGHALDI